MQMRVRWTKSNEAGCGDNIYRHYANVLAHVLFSVRVLVLVCRMNAFMRV